jgi:hypothetical protein
MNRQRNQTIKCLQINLQRSHKSTANLINSINNNNIDIVLAQEPYVINNKVCGFPLGQCRTYHSSADRPKSAIIVFNSQIQILFITTLAKKAR